MKPRTRGSQVITSLVVVVIACVVAVRHAPSPASASSGLEITGIGGNVYCYVVASGPRYFHSRISAVSLPGSRVTSNFQHLERRTLDGLAVKFAGFVAEHHDADAFLSPRCDRVATRAAAVEMIDAAVHFRDGAVASYPDTGKVEVDWMPDFSADFEVIFSRWIARVGLVVGNDQAASAIVSAALGRLGFDVTLLLDADKDTMFDALQVFESKVADGAALAVVFYAGGGVMVDGSPYLVPVDVGHEATADRLVSLDEVVEATAGARSRIVILDTSFIGSGEFKMVAARDLLVAYAALPGEAALDATDREAGANSPYTTALLRHLERPGLELLAMFQEVATDVFESTLGQQAPTVYSALTAPVALLHPADGLPLPAVADECKRQLGSLSFGRHPQEGTLLGGSCWSSHFRDGRYSMHYEFTLDQAATVTMEMASMDVDPFLVLRRGSSPGRAGELEENDDGGAGTDARIERFLTAGTYTIEATTYDADEAGDFALTVTIGRSE